ncbi:hypothetical protein [Streptomyces sp. IBSBF 2435]|uniref:hypothetical protein n=1 Tax=Streptomyces sp. IBSBF 2435 TaxID=2903531 RepID=UPI002FDBFD43
MMINLRNVAYPRINRPILQIPEVLDGKTARFFTAGDPVVPKGVPFICVGAVQALRRPS